MKLGRPVLYGGVAATAVIIAIAVAVSAGGSAPKPTAPAGSSPPPPSGGLPSEPGSVPTPPVTGDGDDNNNDGNNSNNGGPSSPPATGGMQFTPIPDPNLPQLSDPALKVDKVVQGLSMPTSMAFVGDRNLLILQKEDGKVLLVSNGVLQPEPLATFDVEPASERGLLGVATHESDVFVYATEKSESSGEVRNRVYRFTWADGALTNKTRILDLPGEPGPNHDGGKMITGPDGALYVVIGDLNRNGVLQNYRDGPAPDDTSVILKVDREGRPLANVLAQGSLPAYYAYGVRNSFGLALDPLTGALWDTENGPEDYDEINLVHPGFNSGWERVMGPMSRGSATAADLVQLEGSHYADPLFSWADAQGVTDLAFSRLPGKYDGNLFAGDINNGNLYFFRVNEARDGLVLEGEGLADGVADDEGELAQVTLGTGFGGISDIEAGPDGNMYVLSYWGALYRVSLAAAQ